MTLFTAHADPAEPPVASIPPESTGLRPSVIVGGLAIQLIEPVTEATAADWWADLARVCEQVSTAHRARAYRGAVAEPAGMGVSDLEAR